MTMTNLAHLLLETAKQYGDREVTLVEEGTGEIRYVEAISFDSKGDTIELEHVGYDEKVMIEQLNALEEACDEIVSEPAVCPMDLMEMLAILGGM
jgi:phosphotransferase system HPr-like phosphotransfer protein